ncbi:MAG: hypothetical protein VB056_11560 [Sphaerochaeta associata]|nr:hypothetical protein [Sphaerochaeta associata]MEA5029510.1 hypothetical protein [Sphaerochaeta associata]
MEKNIIVEAKKELHTLAKKNFLIPSEKKHLDFHSPLRFPYWLGS